MSAFVFALAFALYVFFLYDNEARIRAQRVRIKQIRIALARTFDWSRIDFLDTLDISNGWESSELGFQLMLSFFVAICALMTLTLTFEGKFTFACNCGAVAGVFGALLYFHCSRRTCIWAYRLLCFPTFVFQYVAWGEVGELNFRRSVFLRVIANLVFFENLEEALLHLLMSGIVMEAEYRHSGVPRDEYATHCVLLLYFFANVPLHVLGVSEWICMGTARVTGQVRARQFLRNMHFVAMMTSGTLMYWTYTKSVSPLFFQVKAVVCFALALALRCAPLGGKVDQWVAPNVVFDSTTNLIPVSMVFGDQVLVKYAHVMMLWLGLNRRRQRWFSLLVQLILVALRYHVTLVFWLTLRICRVCIENRKPSQVIWETFIHMGILLGCLWDTEWLSQMVLILGYISIFATLLLASSRELAISKVKHERESESFLSHAVKQKYSAIGASVRLMERPANSHISALLNRIADECNKGHDRCHATNIYRTLSDTNAKSSRESKRRFNALKCFLVANHANILSPDFEDDMDTFQDANVCLDWEILRLCIKEWSSHGAGKLTSIKVIREADDTASVVLTLDRVTIHRNFLDMLLRFADEINGKFEGNNLVLSSLPFQASSKTVEPRKLENEYVVLSKLSFAVLDDNRLIRRNCENLLTKTLKVPASKITLCGETFQEASFFAIQLTTTAALQGIDICVFDQFLDYGDGILLLGIDVARDCRKRGYKGCCVLHTSVVDISQIMQEGVFHGAVEKSSDKSKFIAGLLNAWYTYKGMPRFASTQDVLTVSAA